MLNSTPSSAIMVLRLTKEVKKWMVIPGNLCLIPKIIGIILPLVIVIVQSVMSNSATPWTAAHQNSLSFSISQSLLKLISIE